MNEDVLLSFVSASLRSVWSLELLLLMRQSGERRWSSADLVRELRGSMTLVSESLASLETAGMVRRDGEMYFYAPASPTLATLCDELERLYRERPVKVVNAIVSSTGRIQSFAEAFRLKGPKS